MKSGWACYVLETYEGPLYIGKTNDTTQRFRQHNAGPSKTGSRVVAQFNGIKRVLAVFTCNSEAEARLWEWRLCRGFNGNFHGRKVYNFDTGESWSKRKYSPRPCSCNESY
jgi:predicted GIY-YIG superfamily endonuclease